MTAPAVIAGTSDSVKTRGGGSSQTLGSLIGQVGVRGQLVDVVLYCPDGSDPNISANTDTVYVGANRSAGFPLGPGGTTTITTRNPWNIGVACATDDQLLFVSWGDGTSDA